MLLIDADLAQHARLRRRRIAGLGEAARLLRVRRRAGHDGQSSGGETLAITLDLARAPCELHSWPSCLAAAVQQPAPALPLAAPEPRLPGCRGDRPARRRFAASAARRAQSRIAHGAPARTGRPSLEEQLLRLVDRDARDAGLLVDPAVAVRARPALGPDVLQVRAARRSAAAAPAAAEARRRRRRLRHRRRRHRQRRAAWDPGASRRRSRKPEQPAHQHGGARSTMPNSDDHRPRSARRR